jgi:alpha-L-rhamnosidase
MKKWVEWQRKASDDLIYKIKGWGDWVNVNANMPGDLISTAFFAHTARLLSKMAGVLRKNSDAKKYERLYKRVRKRFNEEFVTAGGRVIGETQTAWVLGLHFDLLPAAHRERAGGPG